MACKCISELLDPGLQMHLQTGSITASKCISEFNLISASMYIFKLALSWSPSASLSYPISASKCISKLARSQSSNASLSSLNQCLQVLLWLRSSTVFSQIGSMYIYRDLDIEFMSYYDITNLVTVTKTNRIHEMPCGYETLRTTAVRIWH